MGFGVDDSAHKDLLQALASVGLSFHLKSLSSQDVFEQLKIKW
jgi:hypothetical protein